MNSKRKPAPAVLRVPQTPLTDDDSTSQWKCQSGKIKTVALSVPLLQCFQNVVVVGRWQIALSILINQRKVARRCPGIDDISRASGLRPFQNGDEDGGKMTMFCCAKSMSFKSFALVTFEQVCVFCRRWGNFRN